MLINKISLNWEDFFSLINGKSSTHRGGYDLDDGIINLMELNIENELLEIVRREEVTAIQYVNLKKYSSYGIEGNELLNELLVGRNVKKIRICSDKIWENRTVSDYRNIDTAEEWVNEIRIDAKNRKIYVFYGGNAFSGFDNPVEILNMDHMGYVDCEEF